MMTHQFLIYSHLKSWQGSCEGDIFSVSSYVNLPHMLIILLHKSRISEISRNIQENTMSNRSWEATQFSTCKQKVWGSQWLVSCNPTPMVHEIHESMSHKKWYWSSWRDECAHSLRNNVSVLFVLLSPFLPLGRDSCVAQSAGQNAIMFQKHRSDTPRPNVSSGVLALNNLV